MNTQSTPQYFFEHPQWRDTLDDQTSVLIRPMRKQDKSAERAFIEGLSPNTRRLRFLGQIGSPSDHLIDQLTNIDYVHAMAFAAIVQEDEQEMIVGVSRYSADRDEVNCECAVNVSDAWQDIGLGTLLLKHLIDVARRRGIKRMTTIESTENVLMKDLAHHFGFHTRADPGDIRQVVYELDVQAQDAPESALHSQQQARPSGLLR
jgi:GNAT superfamily N-acetyltransferase